MKICVFILMVCACQLMPLRNSAQQPALDSLLSIWHDEALPDTIRIRAYRKYIGSGFLFVMPDSAIALAGALDDIWISKQQPEAIAQADLIRGKAKWMMGRHNDALTSLERSRERFEELGMLVEVADCHQVIGSIYHSKGVYSRAIYHFELSRKLAEATGDRTAVAFALFSLGTAHSSLERHEQALSCFEESEKLMQELDEFQGTASVLGNIGRVRYAMKDTAAALMNFQKSLAIAKTHGDPRLMAVGLVNIGIIHQDKGDLDSALALFQHAHTLNLTRSADPQVSNTLGLLGDLHILKGVPSKALDYCLESLRLAEKAETMEQQKSACECLYRAYKALGKGNEALVYMEKLRKLEDSLNVKEAIHKIEQMEFSQMLLKDSVSRAEGSRLLDEAHREEVRRNQQARNMFAGGAFLLLLVAGGLYSRARYMRRSKAVLQVEKDRSENLLLNILPAEVAEELKSKGRADARDFELVSILFTDFKGFTEASAKLSAADLVTEINTCFEAFDGIIGRYGVEKIKTIGDAYMAAGGLPVPSAGSVKNTVLAALEMQAFISSRKAERDALGHPAFEMRVGIHTGPVVAGIVGVKKFQYDIWGDTVNTASRMESSGEVGRVNISESTYHLLKDDPHFRFTPRGKVEAKGKGEVEMWFVEMKVDLAMGLEQRPLRSTQA
jgi:adenylate cyclase